MELHISKAIPKERVIKYIPYPVEIKENENSWIVEGLTVKGEELPLYIKRLLIDSQAFTQMQIGAWFSTDLGTFTYRSVNHEILVKLIASEDY